MALLGGFLAVPLFIFAWLILMAMGVPTPLAILIMLAGVIWGLVSEMKHE